MVLYVVSVEISSEIESQWVDWMRSKHIPDVMSTGFFLRATLNKVVGNGNSYQIHYLAETEEKLETYRRDFSVSMQREYSRLFEGKFRATRIVQKILKEFK